jgi:cell wall-associated NlpC family hydrolase
MRSLKLLFFIALSTSILGGCASRAPAPVEDARAPAADTRPTETTVTARSTAPTPNDVGRKSTPAAAQPAAPKLPAQDATARSPEMLFAALAAAGFDYQRGGKSMASGFDCSGLVAHVFNEAYGVRLPHNAAAQSERGKRIERHELEPGDLVFFNTLRRPYSHVGIYLGDNRFIHAPKPGAVVRTENMRVAYWQQRYDGARRIVE